MFEKIESLRAHLMDDDSMIKVNDLGEGSKTTNSDTRSIKSIASTAVSPAYQSKILFKIVKHLNAKNTLELGTSLGISTLYLSSYSEQNIVYTLEGSSTIQEIAKTNFGFLGAKNIVPILGHFDDTMPDVLKKIKKLDLGYIDGNHAMEPTIRYFLACLPYIHNFSVLIFDDIYWSAGMTEAWEEIKKHEKVTLTVDLFYFGLVFFNEDIKEKQHFKVLDSAYKPWQKYI